MRETIGFVFTHHVSRIPLRTMFFRFIIYSILAYLAIRFIRRLLSPARPRGPRVATRAGGPAQLIRCQNCGMFVTQTSALLVGGREFCSRACAQKINRVV